MHLTDDFIRSTAIKNLKKLDFTLDLDNENGIRLVADIPYSKKDIYADYLEIIGLNGNIKAGMFDSYNNNETGIINNDDLTGQYATLYIYGETDLFVAASAGIAMDQLGDIFPSTKKKSYDFLNEDNNNNITPLPWDIS